MAPKVVQNNLSVNNQSSKDNFVYVLILLLDSSTRSKNNSVISLFCFSTRGIYTEPVECARSKSNLLFAIKEILLFDFMENFTYHLNTAPKLSALTDYRDHLYSDPLL